jgi:membrane associated rhomboid family serine protease
MFPLIDRNPTRRKPVVTIVLIAANILVFFFLQRPAQDDPSGDLRFAYEYAAIPCEVVTGDPLDAQEISQTLELGDEEACVSERQPGVEEVFPDKRPWVAVLFSMFLHGGIAHLFGNMLFLWIFGNNIEDHLGPIRYLAFYLLAGVVATFAHIAVQPDSTIPLVGASGAIAGVMGAYLVWFPRARILTLVFIFLTEVPAMFVLGFWFISQFFINPMSGVASMAHVGGFLFGILGGFVVRRSVKARELAWRHQYVNQFPPAHRPPTPPPRPDWYRDRDGYS